MFCPNCGVQLGSGVNFCPNCGTRVADIITPATTAAQGNMVMLTGLGSCNRATAALLLQKVCGYDADDALLIVDSAPITIARGLNDRQARYLAQALAEYGLDISIYDGNGWKELESESTSVWDAAGGLLASVTSALGLLGITNRISRDMMHRTDYPYRYAGSRPPVYRLNSALRAAPPRRPAPSAVRPPVHHAPAPSPRPAPRPVPMPPRPAPAPARPAPVPPRPAPAQTPPRPAPATARPVPQPQRPTGPASRPGGIPGGTPGGRNGGGTPGGRPGGGTGRRG